MNLKYSSIIIEEEIFFENENKPNQFYITQMQLPDN